MNLFRKVFLHGLLVLAGSAVTFIGLAALMIRPAMDRQLMRFEHWIAPHVCEQLLARQPHPLPPDAVATMYDVSGKLLASSVQPPVAALSPRQLQELHSARMIVVPAARTLHAYWCGDGERAYIELGPPSPALSMALLVPAGVVVLLVALASIPFARSIARPLAKLVGVTQAFGKGDLGVRVDLPRADEVGALASAFNQMAQRMQQLIHAEQELLANVSHELRTPLARMRVVLETAEESPDRAALMLNEIGCDLNDLQRLVEAVTETMRLRMAAAGPPAHLLPARLEALDVRACAQLAAERFRLLHPDRTLQLAASAAPLAVDADPRLIQRLLDNVLDNARKYSDAASSISLRIRRDEADPQRVVIEVVDRGLGIDEPDLAYLCEPFFRGERSRAHAIPGSGLGLALVKRIVEVHAGELAIASRAGAGTTVRISLPGRG